MPADGFPAWVRITLRDGAGNPLPGRQVRLVSTLGQVTDGGITDVQGRSFAYVTSNVPGDAELTAFLDASACELALPATTSLTFYDPLAGLIPDLAADAAAPYLADAFSFSPEPIVQGVTTTIRVTLANPNDFPIRVTGSFGIAQQGIGLTFGPLGGLQEVVIPAKSQRTLQVDWVPLISGHYCVVFDYSWTPLNQGLAGFQPQATGGRIQRNLSVFPGSLETQQGKEVLEKADTAFGLVSKAPGASQVAVPKFFLSRWWQWVKETAAEISRQLGGDPPRQDYRTIALPRWITVTLETPGPNLSQARADAMNAVTEGLLDILAYGNAATLSLDRYGGAAAARDLTWSAQQASAVVYYRGKLGQAMIDTANALDAFVQVLEAEGDGQLLITTAEVLAYQDRLRTQGFTAQEIQDARQLGWTDAQIEAFRQAILAADPNALAGDLVQKLREEAQALRRAGTTLVAETNYPTPSGFVRTYAATTPNNLAQVYELQVPVPVRNPGTVTDTLTLRTRPMGLPADWSVSVTPASVTLGPGETVTATVTLVPGGPTAQETTPRVALEAFNAASELIGGVVIDVMVPKQGNFNGQLHIFLPLLQR